MNEIQKELRLAESQLSAFASRGTKSSATRARAHLLVVRKECDKLRKKILDESKSKKAKKKAESEPEAPEETALEPTLEEPALEEPEEQPKRRRRVPKKKA